MDLKETQEDRKKKKKKKVGKKDFGSRFDNYHKAKFLHVRNTCSDGKMVNEAGGKNRIIEIKNNNKVGK